MADCIIISAGAKAFNGWSKIQRNLGPYRIASALEPSYDCKVIDFAQYLTKDELIRAIGLHLTYDTLWVGFGSTFFWGDGLFPYWSTEEIDDIINFIRSKSKAKVIYGGVRSLWASDPRIDCYVLGYADEAILYITDSLKFGKELPNVIDSKDFPEPKLESISTHWWRKDFNVLKGEALPLEMARGCIFKCKFCGYSLIGKKKGTYIRELSKVRNDLIRTWEETGCTNYYITDDTFNDDNDKIEAIHKLFTSLPFKIKFSCYLRLDLINKYPHQADLLQEAGMVGNFFGIETLNKQSGVAIGKGLAPNKVKDRLYWLGERWKDKVNMVAGISFGLPYDTIEYFQEAKEWIVQKDNPLSSIEVYPLVLFKKEKNKGDYGSEFSLNPEIYGYEIHSNNYWTLKSQGLDTNIVTHYANDVMEERWMMNKVSEFSIMTQQNVGIKIEDLMKCKYYELEGKFNMNLLSDRKLNEYKQLIGVLDV